MQHGAVRTRYRSRARTTNALKQSLTTTTSATQATGSQRHQRPHSQNCSATAAPRIIHCEDHHPNRMIWFCPKLYHDAITNPFTDAEVFSVSLAPPLTIQMLTNEQLCKLLPTYRKQFADWGKIPTAYVLSKWETNFRQGVPTVAFVQPAAKKLWQALSDILSAICRQACPDATGDGDAATQLKQIKQFLQQALRTPQRGFSRFLYVGVPLQVFAEL